MAKQKSQFRNGYLSNPGSPASLEWIESLRDGTPWLAEIVLEDWRARGIAVPADFRPQSGHGLVQKTDDLKTAVQKVDSLDFSDLGGVRLAA